MWRPGEVPFPAVFIRAPIIVEAESGVEILACFPDGPAVAARQGNLLVCAFHPELTSDLRFHAYFLDIVSAYAKSRDYKLGAQLCESNDDSLPESPVIFWRGLANERTEQHK